MHRSFQYQETWLHKVNPSLKLLSLLILFLAALFINNPNVLMNFTILLSIILFCFSGHPIKRVFLITFPFFLISLTTAIPMILFGTGEEQWIHWGIIQVSKESFIRGLHIGLRAFAFTLLGLLFSLTTRPVYLFYSLMQQLKLSPKYAYSFMAGVRLIPIMIAEFQTIRSALKVRGIQKRKGLKGVYHMMKTYSIALLSQSIRRAHRMAVAMEAKRFNSSAQRTFYYQLGFSRLDWLWIGLVILMVPAIYLTGIHFPYIPITDVRG
ncbi:energy-coupling factor transporter transmembrane component T family protein [Falsibacillus pallidus]|uniref:energy-coupling factor transporter transmembrane component T family protein n=1 Tax=Falsibacillus pallidus TaxID=493781 RepID=UPI003D97B4D7